jgi:hypothetical protein
MQFSFAAAFTMHSMADKDGIVTRITAAVRFMPSWRILRGHSSGTNLWGESSSHAGRGRVSFFACIELSHNHAPPSSGS